ncbi:stationary phase survival protein SurE [Proteiniborus sp. DW1]|uniref:5'/3'-nucleotidase SurE n=1 Tax=Proteiniborus sp. DW1 TaxID=1889883 RepID=UPI00092DF46A|nr:5'/3'-nucleotidase SurE [Proteiniborus sp. DW1]SCG84458.1 stationary phase survival protein SurE [Proteiniborus sp. DW1]
MRLLLVNDDGINAIGIQALAKEFEKDYEVVIVAPEGQRSAAGHSITLTKPILVRKVNIPGIKSRAYSISGSPADCVRVALDKLVDGQVDVVLSGINLGLNVGADVLYSGTVSAAIEGNIYKIPAMAFSCELGEEPNCFEVAAKHAKEIFEKVKEDLIKNNIVLNVNFPCRKEEDIKGIRVCKIGGIVYDYYFVENRNGEDEITLAIKGRHNEEKEEETDRFYLREGYITITPLHYDLTNYNLLEQVKDWL